MRLSRPSRRPRATSEASVSERNGPAARGAIAGGPQQSESLLDDLYKDIILDHYRNPRNRGSLGAARTCFAEGANPLCGDQITIEVTLDGDRIEQVQFDGQGCSISQASASMMTDYVKGKTVEEARGAAGAFQRMMTSGEPPEEDLGDIEALSGVAKFPVRVKCASLSWKTLEQALLARGAEAQATVTTDERSAR
ncbi:MAG: SUF system NifU family Fe-S cluster assembly protein [Dehalococcoidia bacterium]|nr:SUF system NifU family Fe-S cluster assembly protein [Dehalococcoidia bacterium]